MAEQLAFDIAIIGRGPAAAAVVLALRNSDRSICVIAPRRTDDDRIGETLSPAAMPVLCELGIEDPFLWDGHRSAQVTFSSWGTDELVEQHAMLNPAGGGWYLDRNRFEAFLWEQAGGLVQADVESLFAHSQVADDGWKLSCRGGREVSARFVIDCSGRVAAFAGRHAQRQREDTLIAGCSFLEQIDTGIQPTAATMIEARPDGWWYSALIPDGRLVVCAFTDRDLMNDGLAHDLDAWRRHVAQTTWTARRIESAGFEVSDTPRFATAATAWLENVAGPDWAAAGDAAAAFDPLSSHGLTTALWTGCRSGTAALAALDGDPEPLRKYASDVAAGVNRFHAQRRRIYSQETRFRDEPFWQRRRDQTDV